MTEDRDHHQPSGQSGAGIGWAIIGTLLSGLFFWGGIGWLLDRWLDTRAFTPIGLILGISAAIYLVIVKYGRSEP